MYVCLCMCLVDVIVSLFQLELYKVAGEESSITLFRCITMFCGSDNIKWNISHMQIECGECAV